MSIMPYCLHCIDCSSLNNDQKVVKLIPVAAAGREEAITQWSITNESLGVALLFYFQSDRMKYSHLLRHEIECISLNSGQNAVLSTVVAAAGPKEAIPLHHQHDPNVVGLHLI
jgi:hypothetical protein